MDHCLHLQARDGILLAFPVQYDLVRFISHGARLLAMVLIHPSHQSTLTSHIILDVGKWDICS